MATWQQATMTWPEMDDARRRARLRWLYQWRGRKVVIEGERDHERGVVQGDVVESNDAQFPAGILVTLPEGEVRKK